MRSGFIAELIAIAERDHRIFLLTADLGYRVLEPFRDRFPDRFLNVGVAEQNMVGIATGLADAGFIPFVYSISTFASMRGYEFLRNGPLLQHLPVRVIGIGGGFDYGSNGPTHHALEDLGVLRLQPGMRVIIPADVAQARTALRATFDRRETIYFRLSKDDRGPVPGLEGRFEEDRVTMVRDGADALVLAAGPSALDAVSAAEAVERDGIHVAVGVVASIGFTPSPALLHALSLYAMVITVENHYVAGGLGSLVAEVIAEAGVACRLVRCGVREAPSGISGTAQYLNRRHGIDSDSIADTVRRALPLRAPAHDSVRFTR